MKRIVILISGRGSNMEAIVRGCAEQQWPARVVAVIANRADAPGLAFAQAHGIATVVVDHKAQASREAFDAALAAAIDAFEPDLVVLAGFMRILGPVFVQRYEGRLLNIHPSLLPAFPGLHTHRRALEAGCQLVGATVHFVTPELDHGPIVMQSAVPVLARRRRGDAVGARAGHRTRDLPAGRALVRRRQVAPRAGPRAAARRRLASADVNPDRCIPMPCST
jgi:phosphoribosylglycinamide formyltransferase-1